MGEPLCRLPVKPHGMQVPPFSQTHQTQIMCEHAQEPTKKDSDTGFSLLDPILDSSPSPTPRLLQFAFQILQQIWSCGLSCEQQVGHLPTTPQRCNPHVYCSPTVELPDLQRRSNVIYAIGFVRLPSLCQNLKAIYSPTENQLKSLLDRLTNHVLHSPNPLGQVSSSSSALFRIL